ncbi:MAG: serine protease [Opitutales bacterium]|nr:serine protease [Opitutales bacterium]
MNTRERLKALNDFHRSKSLGFQPSVMQKQITLLVASLSCLASSPSWSAYKDIANAPDSTQHVVGGVDATIEEYPWMAALVSTSIEGNTRQFCGATAIAPYWVLTAGHCVDEAISPESFKIVFGTADLENEETAQVFYPKTILIHSDYINSYTKDNDIALIQLREPLPDSIPKVQLSSDLSLEMPGVTARLVGWGITNTDFRDRQDTLTLQHVDMSIVTQEFANLPEYYDGRVRENVIPAGDIEPYHSSGSGDSGGPLLSFNHTLNRWEQIGISNYGAGCDKPENPISAYARISTHLEWINNILNNDFLSWMNGFELTEPDYNEGDDNSPLLEYIFDLDPTVIDQPETELAINRSYGESLATGTLRLRNTVPLIDVNREWSSDLVTWEILQHDHEQISIEPVQGSNLSRYNIPIIISNSDPGFYRIAHEDNGGIIHGPHTLRVGSSVKGLFNRGIDAAGPTHFDYLIDTMGSFRSIRVAAESDIDQPISIKVVELETGRLMIDWSGPSNPDSPTYPFGEGFWPEEGMQYLLRVSSIDYTLPQSFEIHLDHVEGLIDSSSFETYMGELTTDDFSFKRLSHYGDTFISSFAADSIFKIEVRTEDLDQLIFLQDAATGELIEEIDQKPSGETESVLVRFDENRTLFVTVASYESNDTGSYEYQLSQFTEKNFIQADEKTIGLIHSADNTTELSGTEFYLEEIDLLNVHNPAGITVKITGYGSYYPSYLIYNLTAGETIHSAVARCDDRTLFFNPIASNNYRVVIIASKSRLGSNYELEIIRGEVQDEVDFDAAILSSKHGQGLPSENDSEWNVIHQVYKDL